MRSVGAATTRLAPWSILDFLKRLTLAILVLPFDLGEPLGGLSASARARIAVGSDHLSEYRGELLSYLLPFRRRLWLLRSLAIILRALTLALFVWLLTFAIDLLGFGPFLFGAVPPQYIAEIAAGLIGLLALVFAWRQRVTYLDAARLLDRSLGLKAQLGTAVELFDHPQTSTLDRFQVRQATSLARAIEPRQAFGLSRALFDLPRAGLLALLCLILLYFGQIGLRVQEPFDSKSVLEVFAAPSSLSVARGEESDPGQISPSEQRAGDSTDAQTIARLRESLARAEISSDEYARQVAAVESSIESRAADSVRQQEALGDLASALSTSSVTRQAAESIARGDYERATSELASLGEHVSGLSPRARSELAAELGRAAERLAGQNDQLAQAAKEASDELARGDSEAAKDALGRLAASVNAAGGQIAPQAELGDALARARESKSGNQGESAPDEEAEAAARSGGVGKNAQPDDIAGEDATGYSVSEGQSGGNTSTPGGGVSDGAGVGRGEKLVPGGATRQPLDTEGGVLRISGREGSGGTTVRADNPVVVSIGTATSGSPVQLPSGPAAGRGNLPSSVAESDQVPSGLRSVVRDYFGAN